MLNVVSSGEGVEVDPVAVHVDCRRDEGLDGGQWRVVHAEGVSEGLDEGGHERKVPAGSCTGCGWSKKVGRSGVGNTGIP